MSLSIIENVDYVLTVFYKVKSKFVWHLPLLVNDQSIDYFRLSVTLRWIGGHFECCYFVGYNKGSHFDLLQ